MSAHLAAGARRVLVSAPCDNADRTVVFGVNHAELTAEEVLAQIAVVAAAGGLHGVRGLTAAVADRLEGSMELVPTEASAQAVRAFRGDSGMVTIRGGARSFNLSTVAALTFYLDPQIAFDRAGRLAQAVVDTQSLDEANAALTALNVRTELDLEIDAAKR